jgi:hypothetical protein
VSQKLLFKSILKAISVIFYFSFWEFKVMSNSHY